MDLIECKNELIEYAKFLHNSSKEPSFIMSELFRIGMIYLDKYDGYYDENKNSLLLKVDVKGTKYERRAEIIEKLKIGDKIDIIRDNTNEYNSNNFIVLSNRYNIGVLQKKLCNLLAPLFDNDYITSIDSRVSYVEPLLKRSVFASEAIVFVELIIQFKNSN